MPLPACIDIGANLTHASFDADRDTVIATARAAGVSTIIVTGADLSSSRAAAALTAGYEGALWSTAGVHPHHAAALQTTEEEAFLELLSQPRVVAVGECGLDYFRNFSPRQAQLAAFERQLAWAARCRKPVFLHQREAHADFLAVLREHLPALVGGVAHCFTEGPAELEQYLELGLFIGVTGWVCDERRGKRLREAAPLIPPHRLMIETDAPYLLPRDLSPKPASRRNEPRHLPHIAAVLAALRGEGVAELSRYTSTNARSLFGLGP